MQASVTIADTRRACGRIPIPMPVHVAFTRIIPSTSPGLRSDRTVALQLFAPLRARILEGSAPWRDVGDVG
jgi:hypothetical protein